jgi:hypothetical protein
METKSNNDLPGFTVYFKGWMFPNSESTRKLRYYSLTPGQDLDVTLWQTRNKVHAWCRRNGYKAVFIGG